MPKQSLEAIVRLLRYVWVNDILVNAELVKRDLLWLKPTRLMLNTGTTWSKWKQKQGRQAGGYGQNKSRPLVETPPTQYLFIG